MKILHTSDWHLGRSLYGRKRYREFEAFLEWLLKTIEEQQIDILLVAGDVFDTSTPANRAQNLYYQFLHQVAGSCCRHIVIIAGNHDSPSFLNAPRELLRALNVHVVGAMTATPEQEVIVLNDVQHQPQAIICAVPYLRDKDIRNVEPGETVEDKNTKLVAGLKKHYADVCEAAEQKQTEFRRNGASEIPIIAMGHLFTAGGQTIDGDGVRELYVGSLAHVGEDVFPASIDYLALGHLHVPQRVAGMEHLRYSGSPIAMGFGEAGQAKKVLIVEFDGNKPDIHTITVPVFQALAKISGSLDSIHASLEQLKQVDSTAWLEIEYTGEEIIGNLREILDEALQGSAMEICRIKDRRLIERVINSISSHETLDDLTVTDVFERCLDAFAVPDEDRKELSASYAEIVKSVHEDDVNAE